MSELPTSFQILAPGWNELRGVGRVLFDATAARSVIDAFRVAGVDMMIDLEGQSHGPVVRDPRARDARGWCRLGIGRDGSLWATGATWTNDGVWRLLQRRQRYIVPAVVIEPATRRVTRLHNLALCAIAGVRGSGALVTAAASTSSREGDDRAALTVRELRICREVGADPNVYLRNKKAMGW